MEVPLDPEIEAVILKKVASGEYPSVAILVEEALYLLVQRDWVQCQDDLNRSKAIDHEVDPLSDGVAW